MGQSTTRRGRRWLLMVVPLLVAVPLVLALHPWTRRRPEVTPIAGRVTPKPEPTQSVDGQTLVLNGAGIRWVLNWEAYALSLYLPRKAMRAEQVLDGDGPARIVLDVKRPLEKPLIERAFRSGVRRASGAESARIEAELQPFFALLRDVTPGEKLVLTWRRGSGLTAELGATRATVPGDDAARAVFGIWLGDAPVDPILRAELLAGGDGDVR